MEKSEFFSICEQMFAENGLRKYTGRETMERFFSLTEIMRETNEKMNITAIIGEQEIIARHYIDCLFAAKHISDPQGKTLIDIGAGAGFPSLPISAALPSLRVTALDSTAKKVNYMNDTAKAAEIHIHTKAPGPPDTIAVATPTILPVPMVAAKAVVKAAKGEISPSPCPFFLDSLLKVRRMA